LPLGEMESQVVVPLTPVALAVKEVRRLALTESVCTGGAAPPASALNVIAAGVAVNVVRDGAALSTRVTGMVVVPDCELTRIDPLYVPALKEPGATEAVIVRFVVRLPVGVMLSQFTRPVCTDALIENDVRELALTVNVWDAGALAPAVAENESEVALRATLALREPSCARTAAVEANTTITEAA
jgi:hypothetical protein